MWLPFSTAVARGQGVMPLVSPYSIHVQTVLSCVHKQHHETAPHCGKQSRDVDSDHIM